MVFRKRLALFGVLFIFWIILSGSLDLRQILSGLGAAALSIFLYEWLRTHTKIKPLMPMPKTNWLKLLKIAAVSILKSAWHHVFRILSGDEDAVFIQVVLDHDHPIVTAIIANIITLTPGAVTIEVDGNVLKLLAYAPKTESEHQEIYALIDDLQSAFRR